MSNDGRYHNNLDIARLNKRDGEGEIFPHDKWRLIMRSDDAEPPHFHIISEGWDVTFSIESGELIKVLTTGTDQSHLNYMIHNASLWLNSPSPFTLTSPTATPQHLCGINSTKNNINIKTCQISRRSKTRQDPIQLWVNVESRRTYPFLVFVKTFKSFKKRRNHTANNVFYRAV